MRPTRFAERSDIASRMAGFMAHLRMNGVAAGLPETETALRALDRITASNINDVRSALKSVCANDVERYAKFDDLFNAYWLNKGLVRDKTQPIADPHRKSPGQSSALMQSAQSQRGAGSPDVPDNSRDSEAEQSGAGRLVASRTANLKHIDLRALMTPQELAQAEVLARRIGRAMRDRRSRRRKAAIRGAALDLRRIARHSISRGGEPLQLLRKKRPDRPVHIVALLDVSGSMTVYARVFLAFLKGLVSFDSRTDAYLFHTRLVCISDALRDHDTMRAVGRMSLMAEGFGGGTNIAGSLASFCDSYAAKAVNGRTVVIILSDGYCTAPPGELIRTTMALMDSSSRSCLI
jgi:uncharacterized protein with von Willebrand factor type A (vWA) domain